MKKPKTINRSRELRKCSPGDYITKRDQSRVGVYLGFEEAVSKTFNKRWIGKNWTLSIETPTILYQNPEGLPEKHHIFYLAPPNSAFLEVSVKQLVPENHSEYDLYKKLLLPTIPGIDKTIKNPNQTKPSIHQNKKHSKEKNNFSNQQPCHPSLYTNQAY